MNKIAIPKLNKLKIAYAVILVLVIYLALKYRIELCDVIKPFIFASIIAYLLNPIVAAMEKKGIRRIIGIIIVFLLLIALIALIVGVLIPKLIKDISVLVTNLPAYTENMQIYLRKLQDGYLNSNLPQSFKDVLNDNLLVFQTMLLSALQKVADSIIGTFSELFNIVITPVLAFYMLKDSSYFKNQCVLLIPKSKRNRAIMLFRDIDNVFGQFIRGQIIVAALVGILTGIILVLIKVKYAVMLGAFAGISNIIPYFGPFIGIIPTIILALLDSPTKAIYAAGGFIIVQQIECSVLSPKIIGESVGIHPVYVILALIAGGKLMGIAGLIIAVPALAAIKLTMRHVLRNSQI